MVDRSKIDVRLDVHDASRVEWTVTLPCPKEHDLEYELDVQLEVPANVFAQHSPWEHLQSWTRLDRPKAALSPGETVTTDELRKVAVSYAQKLSRISDKFSRECRMFAAITNLAERDEGSAHRLVELVDDASGRIAEARMSLGEVTEDVLGRERALVDEFLSVRLLEMLTAADKSLAMVEDSEQAASFGAQLSIARARLDDVLVHEIDHRNKCGYVHVSLTSDATVDAYLERASRLKKHFQEVLFLEREVVDFAKRMYHWSAAAAALAASTWAFAWQLLVTRDAVIGAGVGSGIIVLAVVGGVVYATKDRLKEVGRNWITGKLERMYAQQVAKWRVPARISPARDVIVVARESFDQQVVHRADPLNPESGVAVPFTLIRFTHRGTLARSTTLDAQGIRRIKHVFRYDLSPLFARLDDAVKRVPTMCPDTGRVRFATAHRHYRVPVHVHVAVGPTLIRHDADLILQKNGLERIEAPTKHDSIPA